MKRVAFLSILLVLLASLAFAQPGREGSQDGDSEAGSSNAESGDTSTENLVDNPDIRIDSRGVKYLVDPSKILSGGPPQDGIPSIDEPIFVPLAEADEWIADNELVLGIIHNGVKRVYPLQILVWHEIVNDTSANDPLLITY